jgi:hypothetical protein
MMLRTVPQVRAKSESELREPAGRFAQGELLTQLEESIINNLYSTKSI